MSVEATIGVPAGADGGEVDSATLAAALAEQRAITEKVVWHSYELQAAGSRRQAAVERLERRLREAADAALAGKEKLQDALLTAERLRGDLAAAEARIGALEAERSRTETADERARAVLEDRTRKLSLLQERLTALMADKASRAINLERQIKLVDQLNANISEVERKSVDLGATLRERQAELARQSGKAELLTSNLAVARATSDMMIVRARIVHAENRRLSQRADQTARELEFRRFQVATRDAVEHHRLTRPSFGRRLADVWQRMTSATPRVDPRLDAAGVTEEEVEAIRSSGYFDQEWYSWQYQHDVASEDVLIDLLTCEGALRNPGPLFDAAAYRAEAGGEVQSMHPLLHYVRAGRAAGVQVRPVVDAGPAPKAMIGYVPIAKSDIEMLAEHPLFDMPWYLEVYGDVAVAGVDPVAHYIEAGAVEGRDPGPYFNTDAYNRRYRDVFESGMNPLVHFLRFGMHEGRLIEPSAAPLQVCK